MEVKGIKVSVIIPVYNPGEYLRPCLDSILGQTMEDLQIIIIDDASTDDSWQVLREYADKDKRIVLMQNPYNLGAARTRNIGIQIAEGDYLSIMDADDYFENDYIETMYNACVKDDLDVAICGVWFVDEQNKSKKATFVDSLFLEKVTKVFDYKDVSNYIFQIFLEVPFNKMVKRDYIEDWCLEFQDIKCYNDVFWGEMCLIYARKIRYINRHMIYYRHNTGKQISTSRGSSQSPVFMVLQKMRANLELTGKFTDVRRSYFTFASILIRHNLSFTKDELLVEGIDFWKKSGLKDIGLSDLAPSNFISDYYYYRLEAIKKGNVKNFERDDENKVSIYKQFFDRLKSVNSHIGIWGFGKNGVRFCREAVRQQLNIVEIYDKDEGKWDELGVPPVKSYDHRNLDVNTVIVTNSRYLEDIVKEVKSRDASVKVVDFNLFLYYGIFRMV